MRTRTVTNARLKIYFKKWQKPKIKTWYSQEGVHDVKEAKWRQLWQMQRSLLLYLVRGLSWYFKDDLFHSEPLTCPLSIPWYIQLSSFDEKYTVACVRCVCASCSLSAKLTVSMLPFTEWGLMKCEHCILPDKTDSVTLGVEKRWKKVFLNICCCFLMRWLGTRMCDS